MSLADEGGDLTGRVGGIAELARTDRADLDTSGLAAAADPVIAPGALGPAALTLAAPPPAACRRGRTALVREVVDGAIEPPRVRPGPWQ